MSTDAAPLLLTPLAVGGLTLANRVVVSPMCQYSSDDGMPGDWHVVHLGSRAVGGAALVWAEMTAVSREGRISPGCAGLYRDEHVAPWRRVTDFVHAHSGSAIGIQLGHAGRKAATNRMWDGHNVPLAEGAWPSLAPSAEPFTPKHSTPRAMTRADMDRVLGEFVAATTRARDAGFDAIELHAAHGYLLSSFLSPISNRRDDAYGGDLTARLRFPLEVVDAVRAAWPGDRLLGAKISAVDFVDGGNTIEDGAAIARSLREHGVDLVSVSAGSITGTVAPPRLEPAGFVPFARRIREVAGAPVCVVGNINLPAEAEAVVQGGAADLVAIGRAHLRDPYWALHAAIELNGAGPEWPRQYCAIPMQLADLQARSIVPGGT